MATNNQAGKRPARAPRRDLPERIVDTAVSLADEVGWSGVRLRVVAERLNVPLARVCNHYRDTDAVADAWFHRAWIAMLAELPDDFATLPARDRIYMVMMRWFDALAEHKRVTGQMITAKLYPSHPHHWVPLVFNLSRTIQWVREAAILDARGLRRQMEEVGLTGVFLSTLATWLCDGTRGQDLTRESLRRCLASCDRLIVWSTAAPPSAR